MKAQHLQRKFVLYVKITIKKIIFLLQNKKSKIIPRYYSRLNAKLFKTIIMQNYSRLL